MTVNFMVVFFYVVNEPKYAAKLPERCLAVWDSANDLFLEVGLTMLHLPSCNYQVALIKLQIPSGTYQVVLTKLSLTSCTYQVALTKLNLTSCTYKVALTKLHFFTLTGVQSPAQGDWTAGRREDVRTRQRGRPSRLYCGDRHPLRVSASKRGWTARGVLHREQAMGE